MAEEIKYELDDFSSGVNRKVSTFQQKKNGVYSALNATFNTIIGGVSKRLGISQKGSDIAATTSTSTSTSTTTTSTSTSTTTTSTTTSSSTSTTTTSTSTSSTTSTTTSTSTSTSTTTTTLGPTILFSSSATNTTTGSSSSWPYSSASGSNRLLVVHVAIEDATSTIQVNSITYNGVALTKAVAITGTLPNRPVRSEIWYLIAPDTGSNTMVTTLNASAPFREYALTLTGAKQSSQPDNTGTSQGTGQGVSVTIAVNNVNSYIWDMVAAEEGPGIENNGTAGADQTERLDTAIVSFDSRSLASEERAPTTGNKTMSWVLTYSTDWVSAVAAWKDLNG